MLRWWPRGHRSGTRALPLPVAGRTGTACPNSPRISLTCSIMSVWTTPAQRFGRPFLRAGERDRSSGSPGPQWTLLGCGAPRWDKPRAGGACGGVPDGPWRARGAMAVPDGPAVPCPRGLRCAGWAGRVSRCRAVVACGDGPNLLVGRTRPDRGRAAAGRRTRPRSSARSRQRASDRGISPSHRGQRRSRSLNPAPPTGGELLGYPAWERPADSMARPRR